MYIIILYVIFFNKLYFFLNLSENNIDKSYIICVLSVLSYIFYKNLNKRLRNNKLILPLLNRII